MCSNKRKNYSGEADPQKAGNLNILLELTKIHFPLRSLDALQRFQAGFLSLPCKQCSLEHITV